MPITRPDIPFSGVDSVTTQGGGEGGGDTSTVRATPEAYGAGVGQAVEKAGETGFDTTQHFAQMATDAKVNDDFANKYAPAAANLRSQYDTLRGPDKVAGYDGYIAGLQNLNKHFTSDGSEMYQKQMGSLIDRHISGEIDGAKRELVQSQIQYEDQAHYQKIKADRDLVLQNNSSPDALNQVNSITDASTTKQYIDNGHTPDSPVIDEAQRQVRADNASAFIDKNVATGNLEAANQIRAEHSAVLSAPQRTQIDDTLHVANIRQTGENAITALKTGQPIPQTVGAPAAQVQATVADTAKASGVDPNHALTVLRIESSNGQNLGKNPDRASIGQDKESAGQPLDVQAATLCKNLKTAEVQADSALGRKSDPWEGYVLYQQGAGGGAALLKADPNAKAVDVLRPLYGSNKEALSAVTNNGGNASMTAEDFLGTIRDTYSRASQGAKCDLPDANPGAAILAPHTKSGLTLQPGADPIQNLMNFNKRSDGYLADIMAIPNLEVRNGVLNQWKMEKTLYSDKAEAYKADMLNQAGQLAANPKFTSMSQVPPQMYSALISSGQSHAITMLEGRADYNSKHEMGIAPAANSIGAYNTFKDLHNGTITNVGQLQKRVWKPGDALDDPTKISIPDYDKFAADLNGKNDDGTKALKVDTYKAVFDKIAKADPLSGMKDPEGELLAAQARHDMDKYYDAQKAKGVTDDELLDQKNPKWVGNIGLALQRDKAKEIADLRAANSPGASAVRKLTTDLDAGKYPDKLKAIQAAYNSTDPAIKISREDAVRLANSYKVLGTTAPEVKKTDVTVPRGG